MKVAIIGAGASGLAGIKCCLDEGLHPVCFEKDDEIGGLWNYVPHKKDGACVYKSTVINSSKEMMCFSDFLIPKEFSNFMHNSKVKEYFDLYAKNFDLMKHIHFHTKVVSCTQADGFATNGQWKVTTTNVQTEKTKTDYYDGVLVCVGHHAIPYYPLQLFPGIDKFKGKCSHSNDYRDYKGYEDLKVLVVGMGNSGGDIAVELSRHAKRVYLSTRRGSWVFKRIFQDGMPADYSLGRRVVKDIQNILPRSYTESVAMKSAETSINHAKYSLRPKHKIFSQHPMVNDEIANRIVNGSIKVKCNVSEFTENTAVFEDGTVEEIDAIIFATGYSIVYPFLNDDILKVNENEADLYKYVFPMSLAKPTLAIIGCVQPLGSTIPISEMQCRWATRVIKREVWLPSKEVMKRDVERKGAAMKSNFIHSRRHTIQVDYIDYMDEVAEQISCKPSIKKWFLKDPKLAMKLYFGPTVPSVYRLEGPGAWSGARNAIMTVDDRILYPLSTRKVDAVESSGGYGSFPFVVLLAVFIMWYLKLF